MNYKYVYWFCVSVCVRAGHDDITQWPGEHLWQFTPHKHLSVPQFVWVPAEGNCSSTAKKFFSSFLFFREFFSMFLSSDWRWRYLIRPSGSVGRQELLCWSTRMRNWPRIFFSCWNFLVLLLKDFLHNQQHTHGDPKWGTGGTGSFIFLYNMLYFFPSFVDVEVNKWFCVTKNKQNPLRILHVFKYSWNT